MEPKIIPTGAATLGALVTDIDLARLDDATWATVENSFHEFGVLIFPGQHLSEEAQIAFGARFGDIEQLVPNLQSVSISNQKKDGSSHTRIAGDPATEMALNTTLRSNTEVRR